VIEIEKWYGTAKPEGEVLWTFSWYLKVQSKLIKVNELTKMRTDKLLAPKRFGVYLNWRGKCDCP